jgi:hypothetical protein
MDNIWEDGFWAEGEEPSDDKIFSLIKENNIAEVRQLINEDESGKYNLGLFNDEGDTPLLCASFLGRAEIVKIIIEKYQPGWWNNQNYFSRRSLNDALKNASENPAYTARAIINTLKTIIYLVKDVARRAPNFDILNKLNIFDNRSALELIQTELFFQTNYETQAHSISTLAQIEQIYQAIVKNQFRLAVNKVRLNIRECKNNAVTIEKIARDLNLSRPIPNNVVTKISRLAVNNKFGKRSKRGGLVKDLKRMIGYIESFL